VKSALPVIVLLLSRLTTESTPAEKLRQQTLSSAGRDQDKQEHDCEGGKAKVQLQQHARLLWSTPERRTALGPMIERLPGGVNRMLSRIRARRCRR